MLTAAHPAIGQVSEINAFFRDGQTFLTWQGDTTIQGETFRVYRSDKPITTDNLSTHIPIANITEGSSRFEEMWNKDGSSLLKHKDKQLQAEAAARIIPRLSIEDAGEDNITKMLSENTELLVWTIKEAAKDSYYAVTIVIDGTEDKTITPDNSIGPISEKKEPIGAVLYYRERPNYPDNNPDIATRHARDWYIMYMDYELWNHEYIGYAFPFSISLPAFKEGGNTPVIHLDGIGTMPVFFSRVYKLRGR